MRLHHSENRESAQSLLLQRMPKSAVCAEIGVWKGEFSAQILQVATPMKLHLIDPWRFQPEFPNRWYSGRRAKNQADMDEVYQSVCSVFRESPSIVIHRGFSEEVLTEFEDNYFDCIFIDGNHSYQYVRSDLEISFRKVKPGGFITGDDFRWGPHEEFPIRKAVHNFVEENKLSDNLELLGPYFAISLPNDDQL